MKNQNQDFGILKKTIASYIDKYPTPTKEENTKNLIKLRSLDPNSKEYRELRNVIALSNGGFAMKYVMKYHHGLNNNISISELFQEAILGVIETIDAFDINTNNSFTTYAFFHIKKRLIDYIKKDKLIRAPRDIARNLKHISEAQNELYSSIGREPSVYEIHKFLKLKGLDVKEVIIEKAIILLDLNGALHDEHFISEYNDQICEENKDTLFNKLKIRLESELKTLCDSEKEKTILRFGIGTDFPHSPEEINFLLQARD